MKLIFTYQLLNNGWAKLSINTRKEELQISVSYILYDTFKMMVRATKRLVQNEDYTEIWCHAEPEIYHLTITRLDKLYDNLSIYKYPSVDKIEENSTLCFQTKIKRTILIHQFYHSIENIRNIHTEKVYSKSMKLPFPTKEFIDLERLITN